MQQSASAGVAPPQAPPLLAYAADTYARAEAGIDGDGSSAPAERALAPSDPAAPGPAWGRGPGPGPPSAPSPAPMFVFCEPPFGWPGPGEAAGAPGLPAAGSAPAPVSSPGGWPSGALLWPAHGGGAHEPGLLLAVGPGGYWPTGAQALQGSFALPAFHLMPSPSGPGSPGSGPAIQVRSAAAHAGAGVRPASAAAQSCDLFPGSSPPPGEPSHAALSSVDSLDMLDAHDAAMLDFSPPPLPAASSGGGLQSSPPHRPLQQPRSRSGGRSRGAAQPSSAPAATLADLAAAMAAGADGLPDAAAGAPAAAPSAGAAGRRPRRAAAAAAAAAVAAHPDQERTTDDGPLRKTGQSSKYRGVTRHRRSGRWEAHLWVTEKGKQVYLGGYERETCAAEAYDVVALKAKGPKCRTNFPLVRYRELMPFLASTPLDELVMSVRRQSQGFARGSSNFRGVTLHPNGRWESRIGMPASKHLYLGLFNNEAEAARAYDRALVRLRGPGGATNFALGDYAGELAAFKMYGPTPAQELAAAAEQAEAEGGGGGGSGGDGDGAGTADAGQMEGMAALAGTVHAAAFGEAAAAVAGDRSPPPALIDELTG